MNDNCVPSIGLATGSPEWGKAAEFPWYIGGLPSYATEAHRFLEYLKKEKPDAKIALLYQDDDFGKSYQATIKKEIKGTKITIAEEYSPSNDIWAIGRSAPGGGSRIVRLTSHVNGAPPYLFICATLEDGSQVVRYYPGDRLAYVKEERDGKTA